MNSTAKISDYIKRRK